MQSADLALIKDIPGYRIIMKAVLKHQIQQLVEQLSETTGEESLLLSASVSDGSLSHLGSESAKSFLDGHEEIKSQFLGHVLKSHHSKKTEKQFAAGPGRKSNTQGVKSNQVSYDDESDVAYSDNSFYSEPQQAPAVPVTLTQTVGRKKNKSTKTATHKPADVKPRPKRSAEAMKSPSKFGIYVDEIDDTELSDTDQEQLKTATVTESSSEETPSSYTDIVPVSGPIPVLQAENRDEGSAEFHVEMGEFGNVETFVVKNEGGQDTEAGTVLDEDDPSWEPGTKKRRKSSGARSVGSVGNVAGDQAKITKRKVAQSPAERQRHFRERRDADPLKRQQYLLKSRTKYQRDKVVGKRKLVKDMTKAEHRKKKAEWRQCKRRSIGRVKIKMCEGKGSETGKGAANGDVYDTIKRNVEGSSDAKTPNEIVEKNTLVIKTEVE